MKYLYNGYVYLLEETLEVKSIEIDIAITHDLIEIERGIVRVREGFKWDGATCAIDTQNFIRGSCVHDALYTLISVGKLPSAYRATADKILYKLCREDGMTLLRASYVYAAVRLFGGKHASNG